jgi:hypothetical protein
LKRQNKVKPANNKPPSRKAANRSSELSQETAGVKPGLAGQLGPGERNGQEDGHLLARLSQADVLQLQRQTGDYSKTVIMIIIRIVLLRMTCPFTQRPGYINLNLLAMHCFIAGIQRRSL